jgi:hypothetical protein
MARGPEGVTFGATAGCVMLATAAALTLIVYAVLTFVALLSSAPAQQLMGMTY